MTRDEADLMDPVAQLRIPPNSMQAEQSVLGGLLLSYEAWDRVGDLLTADDFYRHEHRLIYAAIGALANAARRPDVMTVYDQLEKIGKAEEVGGYAYLNELAQYVASASNIRRYAEIVRERAVLRKLIATADEIAASAFNTDGKPVDAIVDTAVQKIMGVTPESAGDEWESMDSMIVQELDMIQTRADGASLSDREKDYVTTGLSDLDDMLDGGMRGGQLIIIGARPGMGKSAIADTIGIHVAMDLGFPVGKFSMEMQNREGGQRALAAIGRVPLHLLRLPEHMSDDHWTRLTEGVERLRNIPFHSNERGGLNINQVRANARTLHRKVGGLRLLVVDYLQLMSGTDPRAPRTYQLEEASRGLKSLAKELGIPVIALVQVLRGVEKEKDQMPKMSDIKDCGAIEQDADVVLLLDRPIVSKPDLSSEWQYYAKGLLAKQRGGRTGYLNFTYVGENTRFADWPRGMQVPTNKTVTPGNGQRGMG